MVGGPGAGKSFFAERFSHKLNILVGIINLNRINRRNFSQICLKPFAGISGFCRPLSFNVFINGESYRAAGRDATLMRQLADQRALGPRDLARASDDALELLSSWCDADWMPAQKPSPGG